MLEPLEPDSQPLPRAGSQGRTFRGWRGDQGCGFSLGASAGSVPPRDLAVDGHGVIPALLGGEHTQGPLCQGRSWLVGQVCDAVGREPFLGPPGRVPWPSSALPIQPGTQRTFQGTSQDNPLCPPPSRCSSLSPLSTFSPAPPSSSLSFLSHSRLQPFLFQVHHPHYLATSISSSVGHLLAHHPSSLSSKYPGKPNTVSKCQGSRNCSKLLFPGD